MQCFSYSSIIKFSVKQIEISFECYIRYQCKIVVLFKICSTIMIWVTPSIIGLAEQHARAGTNVTVLAKIELIY